MPKSLEQMQQELQAYYGNPLIKRQGRNVRERPKTNLSPEVGETLAGFHPVLGPALSAKDFEVARREGDVAGMGLAGLGMIPMVGGAVKPVSKLLRAGINSIVDTFPSINIPGKINRLEREALNKSGVYGQQRVQRAADEIPNLEKLYQEKALRDALLSNNKAIMTMNPKDFEKFAPSLDKYVQSLAASPNAARFGSFDDYVTHLSKVGAFDAVPQLTVAAPRMLGGVPEIVGHEGRHRSRALAKTGNEKSLVMLADDPNIGVGLAPWEQKMFGSQEYVVSSIKDALGKDRMVMPQKGNMLEQLPDIYSKGGNVHPSTDQMKQELDAYHGSPHRFPPTEKNPLGEFDPTKIGTGEGAQAYGYGHYLAEAEGTGKGYKNAGYNGFMLDGEIVHPTTTKGAKEYAAAALSRFSDKKEAMAWVGDSSMAKEVNAIIRKTKKFDNNPGHLYHVRIPHEHVEKMLDWDKPLSEQHPHVQAAIRQELPDAPHDTLGQDLYNQYGMTAKAASDKLRRAGVAGIKYLDAGSRPDTNSVARIQANLDKAIARLKNWQNNTSSLGESQRKVFSEQVASFRKILQDAQNNPATRNFVVFPGNEHIMKVVHREAKGGAIHEGNSVRVTTYKAKGGAIRMADGGQPFYSPVDQAISKLSQAKGTGDQYLSMIRNTHGVKPQEIEDRGLEQKMTGKMGLPDVQRIASENPMPKITESVAHKSDFFVTQKGDDDKHYVLNDTGKRISGPFETQQNAEGAINRLKENKTQYEKYQLKGGNNYREIKLKLPVQEKNRGAYGNGELSLGYGASNNFKSSHFKDEPNILAHARVSDRKGPNGEKILHVEEIQSDWHQQARDLRHEEIDRLVEKGMPEEEAKKSVPTNWGYGTPEERKHIVDKLARDEKLTPEEESRRRQLLSNRVVPDAPFKKDWHELALKHLLDHAVKNGYDKMIITQGAEQAKRYDLSKHIGEINYKHNPDKTVSLMATDKESGSTVLHEEDVPHHKIHRYVGKGIAKKIMAGEGNPMRVGDPSGQVQSYVPQTGRHAGKMTLSNLDLKTGDEGMKGFYDKIVPDFLNKYGKKWGAKVGTYRMADPNKDYNWSDYVPNTDDMNRIGMERFGVNQRDMTSDQSAEAKEIHRKSVADKRAINLHSFDITPQMREDIMSKGQSRYNKGGDVSLSDMRRALMAKGGKGKDLTKYTDPPSTKIADWKWRDLPEVAADINMKEVPDYIQKNYGEFMKQQLDRAKAGDMTARDFLKAYGITQSSIGRMGLSYDTATKTGMKLPRQDVVRPEGAFSEWLGSKKGQSFLKAAEKGDVNEDSLEDLKEKFSPFSMTNALSDKLKWAIEHSKDNPDLANKFATMPIEHYRDLMMGIKGIGPAKSGFIGSLLGRGDLPTLDARQVLLHTGKYNKDPEFARRTRAVVKGNPVAGTEAVDRLIARQNAMGMDINPSLEPFRQHLTHHAVWDKAGNSETTHGDVVKAMKNYKAGGGIKEPKSTVPAYKLFRVDKKQPGKLFPLFVDANTPVEKDKWVPAKAGEMAGKKVKSKIGPLAYRPGWHAGDLPIATHIGEKSDPKLNKPDRRPHNQVWAEIEMPNDVDWQKKANERGMNKKGKLIAKNAHITDQIPKGGHYRYKTNPNMSGSWLIGGEMKVKRVLPDEEVQKINKKAKVSDLPRSEPLNLKDWGFKHGGLMSLLKKFKD